MAWNPNHKRPLSADCTPRTNSHSMLLSMLPSVVQSRLPSLSSLRRHSNSTYGEHYGSRRKSVSAPGSGSRTPIAGLGNVMVLSSAKLDEDSYMTECLSDEGSSTPSTIDYQRSQCVADENNGIEWKFANQGIL